ncbi:hypothetical protein NON00_24600, partial [Roseomonas sp. GC11]|nr:hypothetical protein [Roseomonas sp. GC11]
MRTVGAAARRLKRRRAANRGWLPRLWLFSDPVRLPDPRAAAAALPRGAGVVARLQEKGVYKTAYAPGTYREKLFGAG